MKPKELDLRSPDEGVFIRKNIIYGAGYRGKVLLDQLSVNEIPVFAFYDDDRTRWGTEYMGKKILSMNEFLNLNRDSTNCIVSSMYVHKILQQLQCNSFQNIYVPFEFFQEMDNDEFSFIEKNNDISYIERLKSLKDQFKDSISKKYFDVMIRTIICGHAIRDIFGLCTNELQYFPKEFMGKLNGINYIDGGAYTGDTIRDLLSLGIKPRCIYAFEANKNNFKKLEEYRGNSSDGLNVRLENLALWDSRMKVGVIGNNYTSTVSENKNECLVEAVTIDEYFRNTTVGFIKMDIEGAEIHALRGGLKTLKRDRPILAISMYHSLEQILKIPEMLLQEMKDYNFFVRHHSYTYSETVLYGEPK